MRLHYTQLRATFAVVVLSLICVQSAVASSIVFSNLGPSNTYDPNHGATLCRGSVALTPCTGNIELQLAVGFTPSLTYSLDTIRLPVSLISGANVLSVSLRSDASGVPSTSAIESFAFAGSMGPFGATNPLLVASSQLHPLLITNTLYWIVARISPGGGDALGAWNDAPGQVMTGLPMASSLAPIGTTSWVRVSGPDVAFEVTGTVVPEPASLTLLALGLAGLVRRVDRSRRFGTAHQPAVVDD